MELAASFEASRGRFAEFLKSIDAYAPDLARIGENRPPEPRWDQVWFPRLDACAAYVMTRERRPQRIVEIGTGHSTRFLARAIRDGGLATRLTTIDPQPRATVAGLDIEQIAEPVQEVPLPALAPGDILFIDSSHVMAPGSDVEHLICRVLPSLPTRALVHFHDIFLPDPYPAVWNNRRYTEQTAVADLLAGGGYALLFASRFVAMRMAEMVEQTSLSSLPLPDGAFENSLWLEKIR